MADNVEEDLLQLLKPSTPADVRGMAVQQLLGMTGSVEGCHMISQHKRLLLCVLHLLTDQDLHVRKEAVKMMINLTAEESTLHALLQPAVKPTFRKMAAFLLERSVDREADDASVCSVLINATREADSCQCVAEVLMESSLGLAQFVQRLCQLFEHQEPTRSAASTVLMNITQTPSVRRGLMAAPDPLLLKLLPIISLSGSLSTCKGIVGTVHNCCFEYDFHPWLLSKEVDLLPRLLLPLAGPEELDEDDMERLPLDLQYLPETKEREAHPQVRAMLIKSVHKLCSTKAGRAFVKEKNTYVILRELHKWEENEENDGCIRDVIDVLIGDEPQEGMEDLHNVEIPPHLQHKILQQES